MRAEPSARGPPGPLCPMRAGDPPSLLERGSTFLPVERELLERWKLWSHDHRRTEFGQSVPLPLEAVLREVAVPPSFRRAIGRRPVFRSYPVPGRPVEGPLVVFSEADERPREGRPYRVEKPVRRLVPFTLGRAPEAWWVEEVLFATAPDPLEARDFFLGGQGFSKEGSAFWHALGEATGVERAVLEAVLLPYVGAPPWRGRRAGVDAVLGTLGVPSDLFRGLGRTLGQLLPPWDMARAARPARRSSAEPSLLRPFHVELGRTNARGWERLRSAGGAMETSFLLFGGVDAGGLADLFLRAHIAVLEPLEVWSALGEAELDAELAASAADHLVRAHFHDPALPENDRWRRAQLEALRRLRPRLEELPSWLDLPPSEDESWLLAGGELGDHLVQAALGRARLLGREEVRSEDFAAVAERLLESLGRLDSGRPEAVRELLRTGERVRLRRSEVRLLALRSVLLERGESSAEELYARLRRQRIWKDAIAFERDLERAWSSGRVFSPRPGRWRWVGL